MSVSDEITPIRDALKEMKTPEYKFKEDEILSRIKTYIDSTYGEHYIGEKSDIQMLEIWDEMNIAEAACMSNIMKYGYRYGKKKGQEEKDLLKIIHYGILAYYYMVAQHEDEVFNDDSSA